jgi:glycosyltransferase involved in cell wall biosynthesis
MKIAFISGSTTIPMGFGQQTKILADYFRSKGHEIFVLCENRTSEETPGIEEYALGSFDVTKYDKELYRIKPDVVLCFDWYMKMFQVPYLSYSGRCKFLMWFPYESTKVQHGHRNYFVNLPENRVVFISDCHRKIWSKYANSTTLIPHAVDIDTWTAPITIEERNEVYDKFRLNDRYEYVININRNDPRKRWDLFFEAAEHLLRRNSNFRFIVHSNRDNAYYNFDELEDWYGIKGKVIYTDFNLISGLTRKDLANLVKCCSLRLDPSSGEGFGLSVAEVAAAGVPQLVFNHTTMPEILGQDYPMAAPVGTMVTPNGMYISGTGESLVKPFESITETHVESAKQNVINKFHPTVVGQQWLDLIEKTDGASKRYRWGFNGSAEMGYTAVGLAYFASKIGGKVVEIGTHDGRVVDACLYHGLDITSYYDDYSLPMINARTKASCRPMHDIWSDGRVLIMTDYHEDLYNRYGEKYNSVVNQCCKFDWILLKRSNPSMTEFGDDFEILGRSFKLFTRRRELEAAMKVRYNSFSHEIWSKDPDAAPQI